MGFYKVHFFNLLNKTTRIETHKWLFGAEPPTSIVDTHCRRFVAKLVYKKSTLKKGDYIIFKAREVTRLLRHNVLALSFFDRVIP